MTDDPWRDRLEQLGGLIRRQRTLAGLSLRQVADLADVSNAYLSQIERGKHEPSVRVLRSISHALGVSADSLLGPAGLLDDGDARASSTEAAIAADPELDDAQKQALLAVYRSYLTANRAAAATLAADAAAASSDATDATDAATVADPAPETLTDVAAANSAESPGDA